MGSPVKQLPFDKTGNVTTRVPDTPDIQAARGFDPQTPVLDAATQNEFQMARDDNERRVNSSFSAGVPNATRLTQPARFNQRMMTQRGYALSAGEESVNRIKLQQKLALAEMTRGQDVNSRESGYTSGIKESPGIVGSIVSGIVGGVGGRIAASDERLKKDIKPAESVLDRLDGYQTADWQWKDGSGEDTGVIAQDMQKTFPEVVGEDPEAGNLTVDYGKLGALALQGVKELRDEMRANINRKLSKVPKKKAA